MFPLKNNCVTLPKCMFLNTGYFARSVFLIHGDLHPFLLPKHTKHKKVSIQIHWLHCDSLWPFSEISLRCLPFKNKTLNLDVIFHSLQISLRLLPGMWKHTHTHDKVTNNFLPIFTHRLGVNVFQTAPSW